VGQAGVQSRGLVQGGTHTLLHIVLGVQLVGVACQNEKEKKHQGHNTQQE
jgi:hypothetical protein